MCGIAIIAAFDFYSHKNDHSELESRALFLANHLKHRGPDGIRSWISPDHLVAMAHARLSIIDLESGWQPMVDPETGCALCFNGEIYNYVELREELKKLGVRFRTSSDSEVLLYS